MRKSYDFSRGVRNPYAKRLKQQITINIAKSALDYFQKLAKQNGIGYQVLIDLYLRDCVEEQRKPHFKWAA
jgi:uncharacterized protein (DUF4415 family)